MLERRERKLAGVSGGRVFINFEAIASKDTTENSGERTMMGQVPKEAERDDIKFTGRGRYKS